MSWPDATVAVAAIAAVTGTVLMVQMWCKDAATAAASWALAAIVVGVFGGLSWRLFRWTAGI